ncbi:MAG: Aspartate--tRNA ligase [Candidatus Heimdallarchaeota archaeon LC_3]|nr:MAG: Aspartate--tRNA ligase [Candidatus Heimdallarchaeota archaeon LC_3]
MMLKKRSNYAGELRKSHVEQSVTLMGWVFAKRLYKKLAFVDLRDRKGLVQLVFVKKNVDLDLINETPLESVIWINGTVVSRKEANPDLFSGDIEVQVSEYGVINKAEEKLPFAIHEHIDVSEDLRYQYRYLDLRRNKPFHSAILIRHKIYKAIWDIMDNLGFIHVETPNMIASTPEGARDYLIPSRVHQGKFYALPQSPQILKQILMVSGVDKYFQIAKCFRDEDLRSDRQPEFTQLDIEMSFVTKEDVMDTIEKISIYLVKEVNGIEIENNFPILTFEEVMKKFGSDKPDLRWDGFFQTITYQTKKFKAIACENASEDSIKNILTSHNWFENSYMIIKQTQLKTKKLKGKGNLVLLIPLNNSDDFCSESHELFRRELMKELNLIKEDQYVFAWVHDFPLFEFSEEDNRLNPVHHPFTSPHPEDIEKLETSPNNMRANAYDLILNGYEIGGGSIRIHNQKMQEKIFTILNISLDEQQNRFGFLLDSFRYGAPPHGGMAFGLDRFLMILAGGDSIREVITFPKNKLGECPLTGAPNEVDTEQLDILGLKIK